MCLKEITNEITAKEGWGWKVYIKDRKDNLRSLCQGDVVVIDWWMEADPARSYLGYCRQHNDPVSQNYRHGFHMYHSFRVALCSARRADPECTGTAVVKRVKYRKFICSGRGITGNLEIVAEDIYVPSDKEWKPMKSRIELMRAAVPKIERKERMERKEQYAIYRHNSGN
jgi:hypothetical protein